MESQEMIKDMVKQKYGEIARQDKSVNQASCCGSGCCSSELDQLMNDDYSEMAGYNPDADLGLGCGLPTQFAKIKAGDTVVDLGSGAGNDAFVARHETGANGKVIGVDFTPAMVELARKNAGVRKLNNVEFRLGDIENIPVEADSVDVVVSNCVLNLVPDKQKVFREIFRILRPGAHFSISDIVLDGGLPEEIRHAAEMYAGCVSGAVQKNVYVELIKETGFGKITVQKDKEIRIPDDILRNYLSEENLQAFKNSGTGIRSITVYAEKPAEKSCCGPDCCSS